MKIAFLSYEYPPETSCGGVATYTYQAAKMMAKRGHQVEVFAGSEIRSWKNMENDVLVHRLLGKDNDVFYKRIAHLLAQRNKEVDFDVVEAPELDAEARYLSQFLPNTPLVIKLHSGNLLLWECNHKNTSVPISSIDKISWYVKARIKGYPVFWKKRQFEVPLKIKELDQLEGLIAHRADHITAPSRAIIHKMIHRWGLDINNISQIPNPYIPSPELLAIPADSVSNTITFIGRFSINKGLLDLALAIPLVLRLHPQVKFRFVGGSRQSILGDLRNYLEHFLLHPYKKSVEFTGPVDLDKIPEILANTDICVIPSHWDNFPGVCLEAMAAARGIIGTESGGMTEMLDNGACGTLIPPMQPQKLADAMVSLLSDVPRRIDMGKKAREKVLSTYNLEQIGSLQEKVYQKVITQKNQIPKPI